MSQPVQNGSGVLSAGMPSRTNRSRWFRAQARTRTSTSVGLILGSGTSCSLSLSGPPNSLNASAFTRVGSFYPLNSFTSLRQARIVEGRLLAGLVERGAVEQAGVALRSLRPMSSWCR